MQLRDHQSELRQRAVEVRVVTFDDEARAASYAGVMNLPWPILLDRNRNLYHAYRFGRATWWTLYNPVSILRYLWLMVLGRFPHKPGRDWNQLGGNVLIDPDGIVQMVHASRHPHDRPSVARIIATIEAE